MGENKFHEKFKLSGVGKKGYLLFVTRYFMDGQ